MIGHDVSQCSAHIKVLAIVPAGKSYMPGGPLLDPQHPAYLSLSRHWFDKPIFLNGQPLQS